MNYSTYKYIDYAEGGVNHRNNVRVITELESVYGKNEVYRTIFRFDDDYRRHFEKTKSVGQFAGKCYADWMPFDIDDEDLSKAWSAAKAVINLLNYDYSFDVQHIFFSGAKGFHILIPIQAFGFTQPSEKMPMAFKGLANDIAGDLVDSTIYELNRLFRMVNTCNAKTGMFKIPLTIDEFYSGIENIKLLAKEPHKIMLPSMRDCVLNKQFEELYQKHITSGKVIEHVQDKNLFEKLGGVGEGERDVIGAKFLGILKSKGMEPELAMQWLRGWNSQNTPPMSEDQLHKLLISIYSYDEKKEQTIESQIKPVWAVYDEYDEFVNSKRRVDIGIAEIDGRMRGIRPGQVLTILGYTGNYKSATLQDILRGYHARTDEPVLLFELEMSRLDIFERACQMEAYLTGRDVEMAFKDDDRSIRNELINLLTERQRNFFVVDASNLSFADMQEYIRIAEEKIVKRKINLIGIDFLQLMEGIGRTNTERADYIAKEMKNFAKQLDVALIVLSQVTGVKSAETEITEMDVRDSKTIVQMSDYVIALYLEEMTDNEKAAEVSPIQIVDLRKNRKGKLGSVRRMIEQKTLTFKLLDEIRQEPDYKSPF